MQLTKMYKGAVTTAHSAITGTTTSAEINCDGYNSILIEAQYQLLPRIGHSKCRAVCHQLARLWIGTSKPIRVS